VPPTQATTHVRHVPLPQPQQLSAPSSQASLGPRVDLPRAVLKRDASRWWNLDGDGKLDILAVDYGEDSISACRNTASAGVIDSGFLWGQAVSRRPEPSQRSRHGRPRRDGRPDAIVAKRQQEQYRRLSQHVVAWVRSHSQHRSFSRGNYANSVEVADFDGDGKPDVAATHELSSYVAVLRNTTTSSPLASPQLRLSRLARDDTRRCRRHRQDGKPDMAASRLGGSAVLVFRNTSSPGAVSFAGMSHSRSSFTLYVSLGDVDGDGKVDLTVANANSATIFNPPQYLHPWHHRQRFLSRPSGLQYACKASACPPFRP